MSGMRRGSGGIRWLGGTSAVLGMAWLALGLSGCGVLVPGQQAYGIRVTGHSSVKLPVRQEEGRELIPDFVKVQQIDANFVIAETKKQAAQKKEALKPVPHRDYRIGRGDILSVTVFDHPELTTPAGQFRSAAETGFVVAEDGTLFFPYAGVVKVEGLTLRQVRSLLTQKLGKYIEDPQVDVRVAAFRSQRIFVVGEVGKKGVLPITDIRMTTLEAINQAGGFTDNADQRRITITRNGKTFDVDLQALYEDGDLTGNVLLQDGDVVNVWDREHNKVFMLGAIMAPGSLAMKKGRLTLAEALSDRGNLNQFTANPYQIFVIRGGDKPAIYHLASLEPDAMVLADQFPLRPRDLIYVDEADVVRWNKLISNILPTTSTLQSWGYSNFPAFRTQQ